MKLFRKTLYNCKQATTLIIKKSEVQLTLKERCQLFYHLLYCDPCNRFKKQSEEMDKMFHHIHEDLADNPTHQLPDDRKKEMEQLLKEL